MSTEKVSSTGRYGSRYGVSIKKRVLKVEERQAHKVPCPFCGFAKIKREAAGLFFCKKCDARFAGGAYEPETLIGKTIKKMVNQRTFLADSAVLIKAKESSFADIEKEVESAMAEDSIKESKKQKKAKEAPAPESIEGSEAA